MVQRTCEACSKTFACRQSLFKHKKWCKGSGLHMASPPVLTSYNSKPTPLSFHHCDIGMEKSEDENSEEENSDVSMEDENSAEEVDLEEIMDEYLWETFAIISRDSDWTIFQCLIFFLNLYYELPNDGPYQEIMEDVENAESTMGFTDALDYAINKNEDLICTSVANCRDCDVEMSIWCNMAQRVLKHGCKWWTGSRCDCDECKGSSLLKEFRAFAFVFMQWRLMTLWKR